MSVEIPAANQLVDVIGNSSVGIAVSDGSGKILLHNRAQSVLFGAEGDHLKGRITELDSLLQRLNKFKRIDNVKVDYVGGRTSFVSAVQVEKDGQTRIHWVGRPQIGERLPVSNTTVEDNTSDAARWIRDVDNQPIPALAPTESSVEVMREFYIVAPVAIHLIGINGEVMHANPADIALVDQTATPTDYVGNHIRQIYQDQGLVEDFLGRWDDDSPIINFRANFVGKTGLPKPVLIFSTAQASGGSVTNTRCFVFSDPEPQLDRDKISAFDWQS